jgi:hypothetical protein
MVSEQIAAQQVETGIAKGKGQSIACHRRVSVAQMGEGAIKHRDLQMNPAMLQPLARSLWNVARSRRNFEQRQRRPLGFARHTLNHVFGSGDATEPTIDPT